MKQTKIFYMVFCWLYICIAHSSYANTIQSDSRPSEFVSFDRSFHRNNAVDTEIFSEKEVSKTIHRQMEVGADAVLEIENQFGNIFITEGNTNAITFTITVMVKGQDQKKVQDMANRIDVKFSESRSKVSAKTLFPTNNNLNNENDKIEVNYTVTVPASIYLQLNNKFGNIYLKDCKQGVDVSLDFGDMEVSRLQADNNNIKLKFGKLKLQQAKNLQLEMSYSKAEIGAVSRLICSDEYSSTSIQQVDILKSTKFVFGKMYLATAGEIETSDVRYSTLSVEQLMKRATIRSLQFSQLDIKNIDTNFENISVGSAYSEVKVELSSEISCNVDLSVSMADIKMNGLKLINTEIEQTESVKTCVGIIGEKKNPEKTIQITSVYKDIILEGIE